MKRVSQKEIAKALNLSEVTVSRALRNHPDLAKDTRERILQKAKELGFFNQKKSQKVLDFKRLGVLLYNKDPEKDRNQFWLPQAEIPRRILAGIQEEAYKRQIELVFEMPKSDDEVPLMVKNRTVGGILLMGRYSPTVPNHLKETPAVAVSNYIANNNLPRVVVDNFRGAQTTTEHLISLGHKRILFFGDEGGGWSEIHRQREKGYQFAMLTHGLKPESFYCPYRTPEPFADLILEHTAIVASNDGVAFTVQEIFRKNNRKPCAVTGFDGDFISKDRKLTTYEPNWPLLGALAVDLVTQSPEKMLHSNIEILIPGTLIVRDSSIKI